MANYEKGEVLMLSETHGQQSDELVHSKSQKRVSSSTSISIPMTPTESYGRENSDVGPTGPVNATHGTENDLLQQSKAVTENKVEESNHAFRKNEHLRRSGRLGMCNDPYCTTCPTEFMASRYRNPKASTIPESKKSFSCSYCIWPNKLALKSQKNFLDKQDCQGNMANYEKGEVLMLSETHGQQSDELVHSKSQKLVSSSTSVSIPMTPMEENSDVGPTGLVYATHGTGNDLLQHSKDVTENKVEESNQKAFRKNEHLPRSDFMGSRYRNPEASTIPESKKSFSCSYCIWPNKLALKSQKNFLDKQDFCLKSSDLNQHNSKSHNASYGDAKGFARKSFPGIMNPHNKVVRQWNKFLAIFCLLAIFVDPLFFFLLYVEEDNKCIAINRTMTKILVIIRSINDSVYFLNILLQFRIAKVDAGDLVDDPKKIALHYMWGYFILDLFIVIPLPQIMMDFVLPKHLGSSGANFAKNLLRVAILVQYIPRLLMFLPLLIGWSPTGFIFKSPWSNLIINLLIFMLSGHVVGSCWYLFGLQRVNQCLRDACHNAHILECMKVVDCGRGHTRDNHFDQKSNSTWSSNTDAIKCLNPPSDGGFPYGIYSKAVPLTMEMNMVNKYIYSLFWGFQQISTLAGNQTPSYFVWELIFTMVIIGMGLFLFALLIGNIQNLLQAHGQRRLDMQIRVRGVEQWMSTHCLTEDLKRRVRQAERYSCAATSGVNEEMLLENLPEDLQRDIRRHLCKFIEKDRVFCRKNEHFLDAIYKRLRRKTYIQGSIILCQGGLVEKMVFVVRGKLESIGEDGIGVFLSEGDACGEELLKWYLEHPSVSTDGKKVRLMSSNRTVTCLTNVDAFSLRAADLEEVISYFSDDSFADFIRSIPKV